MLDDVEKEIPTIVFEVKDGDGNDVSAVRVVMDGGELVPCLDGKSITVDPGEHVFRFESSSGKAVTRNYILREGEKNRRERIVIAR